MLNQVSLDKEELIQKLGKYYRKGRFAVSLSFYGIINDEESDVVSIASEIILALRKMPKEQGMILINNYFVIKEANWWKEHYTQKNYNDLKAQAIDQFLELLPNYCIYEIQNEGSHKSICQI